MLEQETKFRQLSQEQLDNFTLDMNTAYARLKGVEEAIDSKICASTILVKSQTFFFYKRCTIFVVNFPSFFIVAQFLVFRL